MSEPKQVKSIRGVEFQEGEQFLLRGVPFHIVSLHKRGLVLRVNPLPEELQPQRPQLHLSLPMQKATV